MPLYQLAMSLIGVYEIADVLFNTAKEQKAFAFPKSQSESCRV